MTIYYRSDLLYFTLIKPQIRLILILLVLPIKESKSYGIFRTVFCNEIQLLPNRPNGRRGVLLSLHDLQIYAYNMLVSNYFN